MSDREALHSVLDVLEAKERDRAAVVNWAHKGEYEARRFYGRGDVVRLNGATYVSVSDTPGPCPDDGWQMVANVGARGEKGDRGDTGPVGKAGQPGPPGAVGAPGRSIRWRGRYAPFTEYNMDDVVHYDNALWIALQPTETGPKADQVNWDLVIRFFVPNLDAALKAIDDMEEQLNDHSAQHDKPNGSDIIPTMMYMVAPYTPYAAVKQGAVAKDGNWLMHANKDTNERAAPQTSGEPTYQYDGVIATTQDTVKQIVSGQRYTVLRGGFVPAYRVYAVVGQSYDVYLVKDPLGVRAVNLVASFTPSATGWAETGVISGVVAPGEVFDLLHVAKEGDPTPVVWSGNWNYNTPNNDAAPGVGEIVHANSSTGLLNVHKTDADGGDRGTELEALTTGDQIHAANGLVWSIQSTTDVGDYMAFGVSPGVQAADGVQNFDFNTLTATPVTYLEDAGYWTTATVEAFTVRGLLSVGGGLADVIEDDNAYGTDVQFQNASISDDWDIMSYSG
jgi:hypothetical protein